MNFFKKINQLFLNKDELIFIKEPPIIKNNSGNSIFIQCTNDFFYLKLYSLVLKQESNNLKNVVGLITIPFKTTKLDKIFFIPLIIKIVLNSLRIRKIKKLYKSIGVDDFYSLYNINIFTRALNIIKAITSFIKIKHESDVLGLKIKGIKCGDLIYDTVVRFSEEPRLRINSFDLLYSLFESLNYIYINQIICKKFSFSHAFLNQAVYTHHGITARFLLQKNVNVYTSGYFPLFKKLSIEDPYMMPTKYTHLKLLQKTKIDNSTIQKSLEVFGKRFHGEDDLGIIKHFKMNPYNNNKIELNNQNEDFEGVLFLHDFFDSHKLYGPTVFYDFDHWTKYTLNLIRDFKLKIAIKPHPLQIRESEMYLNKLQKEYKDLTWINPNTSNLEIFKKGILYGISHHGTILSELAYLGIKAISCSESPMSAYDICYEAKTIDEYKNLILNVKQLDEKTNIKHLVGHYYYNNYSNESDYTIKSKLIEGVNIYKTNRYNFTSKDLLINDNNIEA